MNRIWANRLIAGTQHWADVPAARKDAVRAILMSDVEKGVISQDKFNEIMEQN